MDLKLSLSNIGDINDLLPCFQAEVGRALFCRRQVRQECTEGNPRGRGDSVGHPCVSHSALGPGTLSVKEAAVDGCDASCRERSLRLPQA